MNNVPLEATGRIPGRRLLHSPGPTPVPEEVMWAMSRQPMDLGDPRSDQIIAACETGLRRLLQTEAAEVFLYASNGHGVWEAVVENLLPVGGTALVPGTGHFSESWAVQTEALGRRVLRTPWVEGRPIDLHALAQALRQDRLQEIRAVFVVHTDTSSGVSTDLAALRAAMDATGHPALLVVDVVASLGAAPFGMDALRADVVVGASQKGLMCPPGIGIIAVNAAAMAQARVNPSPRYYWDWVRRLSDRSYHKFCGTAPQTLVAGLEAALGLLFREGLAAGTDVDALRQVAREQFQVAFAGALGPLMGRAFRIGHLGDQNPASMLGCLAGIEGALLVQGVPIGHDGLARAVAVFQPAAR